MNKYFVKSEIVFNVEFYDVDSMKIVWHGNYIKYMEKARCALLDKIGYNYLEMEKSGYLFPIVDIKLKYVKSLYFGQKARAVAYLTEYENCIRIKYEIYNEESGELTTKGESMQMAVNMKTGESCFVCPDIFIKKVDAIKEN